ncbi:hypothetical protein ACCD06_33875 [Azospirillum sp. CT11-132]|uniref:hypothetical protein n=1 Tax=Azospirillum sp. CT11-132 TaxID=3396317 RepID=UPI0039A4B573
MTGMKTTEIDDTHCITGGYHAIDDDVKSVIAKVAPPSFIQKIFSKSSFGNHNLVKSTGPRIRIGITGEGSVDKRRYHHHKYPLKSGGIYFKMYLIYKTTSHNWAGKVEERLIRWAQNDARMNVANPTRYNRGNAIKDKNIYVYVLVGRRVTKKEHSIYIGMQAKKDEMKEAILSNSSTIVFNKKIDDLQIIHNWVTANRFSCSHFYSGDNSIFAFTDNSSLRAFHSEFGGNPKPVQGPKDTATLAD